ncbi:hypothetical protein ACIGXM_33885 [Kitasatospora sp. NPDC052896]|uniref:hypothetical protein n=1 Tax=Kitasatospora sp. NPDC052896 TaxID=3364061 RepID=UPI0037CC2659
MGSSDSSIENTGSPTRSTTAGPGRPAGAEEPTCWAAWTTKHLNSGPGGVRTVEVGVMTGDLTVHTTWTGSEAVLTVQYTGALDWHTLEGSPLPAGDENTARALHQHAVEAVKAGGGTGLLR